MYSWVSLYQTLLYEIHAYIKHKSCILFSPIHMTVFFLFLGCKNTVMYWWYHFCQHPGLSFWPHMWSVTDIDPNADGSKTILWWIYLDMFCIHSNNSPAILIPHVSSISAFICETGILNYSWKAPWCISVGVFHWLEWSSVTLIGWILEIFRFNCWIFHLMS